MYKQSDLRNEQKIHVSITVLNIFIQCVHTDDKSVNIITAKLCGILYPVQLLTPENATCRHAAVHVRNGVLTTKTKVL